INKQAVSRPFCGAVASSGVAVFLCSRALFSQGIICSNRGRATIKVDRIANKQDGKSKRSGGILAVDIGACCDLATVAVHRFLHCQV
ncbi:MAG: hypothetical protein KBA32_12820, partial [Propionivibrio sp.]|uniref:hypothetical protein n=1 Tax=Propionivibrio sp. TaxID=2212460 RepID=UPI001B56F7D4